MKNPMFRKSELAAFNDEEQIKNFVRYLTRTDVRQKWTTDETSNNLYAIRQDDGTFAVFSGNSSSSFGHRKEIEASILSCLELESINSLGCDILQVFDYLGDEEEDFDESLQAESSIEDCKKIFKDIVEDSKNDEDVLILVMHNDQKYDGPIIDHHIHRIMSI